jgi:tetratricopeptide (TPR) repeat protein
LAAVVLPTPGTLAQPVIDQFVASAAVTASGNCSVLRVNFNWRVRYTGHFPPDRGSQLRISLQLVDRDAVVDGRLTPREGVRVDNGAAAGIVAVDLALDQSIGPVLEIRFARPTAYQVVQSGSFEQVAVAISKNGSAATCKVSGVGKSGLPSGAGPDKLGADVGKSVRSAPARAGGVSESDAKAIDASMDEARAAIKKSNFAEAADLLKKVLKYPENKSSAEAQELLGVVRLKAGQRTAARAEFEDYLRRYPDGEGAERVRQRLAALLTAEGAAPEKLRGSIDVSPGAGEPKKTGSTGETRWSVSGSVSGFYITNDSATTAKDLSTAPNPNADPDAHRSHLNTLLANYDMFGTADNDQIKAKFKLAFTQEHQLDNRTDKYGVSTASVDYTLKEYDVTARVGRQSRNTGGVIGRFDGAVVSWQQSPDLRFNVLAGSPNWSRFDAPFANGKSLYGTSVDFGKWFGVLETSLFAIEQYDRDIIDRRAVGAEFRYFDRNKSALGTLDYDVHFNRLNAAIFSGTYTLEDKSVINTALDYRKVPYLSTWNALQGQPFLTLYDMMKFNTAEEVRQFAIDRTPTFESAMVSYSRPLSETYQIGADATVTNLSGTMPSGGVDGTPASGLEYYVSTQLTGTGIFKPGDLLMGAVRYASLSDSKIYVLDLNTRYPVTPDLSVSPRLRLGYRRGVGTDLREITVLPSFLVNYIWWKGVSLEAEIGTKYLESTLSGVKSTTKDLFATLGIRKDFGTDGVTQCHASAVSCAWAKPAGTPAAAGRAGTSPPLVAGYAIETGLRYWFSSAKNRYSYFADSTPSTEVSRLSYGGLAGHSGEVFFRVDALDGPLTNMFVKGFVGAGKITSGKLFDEDFQPFVDPSSKTSSSARGNLQYASIDLGYNLLQIDRFRFGAFVGYHHWLETVDVRGCTQIGGNPFICAPALPANLKVITEQDRWETGRAGISVEARLLDRLTWQAEIAYAWTTQHATDTHYLTFGRDPASGRGQGFQTESTLKYQLNDSFEIGIGGRWWHFNTDAIDSFDQMLRYTTDRYGVFVQGTYKFN